MGRDLVVTVRQGEASELKEVRQPVEGNRELLRHGPPAILYAIMDRVVEDYVPVLDGLENDIDEIESEVFGGNPNVSRHIYELSREVIEFHRATQPLAGALERLIEGEAHGVDDLEVADTCAPSATACCGRQNRSKASASCSRTSST